MSQWGLGCEITVKLLYLMSRTECTIHWKNQKNEEYLLNVMCLNMFEGK